MVAGNGGGAPSEGAAAPPVAAKGGGGGGSGLDLGGFERATDALSAAVAAQGVRICRAALKEKPIAEYLEVRWRGDSYSRC